MFAPTAHPRCRVHVSALGEECLGSAVLTEVQVLLNNLSKHIIPCIRGRTDFSCFDGRVPSAESQLSVLENLFCWRFHASPVPETQAACVILCFEVVLFSQKLHVCVSLKILQNKHSKYICFIILIDVVFPTSEEVKAAFLFLETFSDRHTYVCVSHGCLYVSVSRTIRVL